MGLFSKKTKEPEEDNSADKSALFGKRGQQQQQQGGGGGGNPYAQQGGGGGNPYAQQGGGGGGGGYGGSGGGYGGSGGGYNSGGGNSGYGGSGGGYGGSGGGYGGSGAGGGGGYGNTSSYGREPAGYGGAPEPKSNFSSGGAGGRPGMGRNDSDTTYDSNRSELFGGKQRQQQLQQQSASAPPGGGYGQPGGGYSQPGGYGANDSYGGGGGGYGGATRGDRSQMTAEQEEEEDVDALKQQIRFTKQESVASTRNALRAAEAAEATGRDTLARLGEQGERLMNTEKNLDLARTHGNVAEEKARQLKTLNRSMFAVHVANPFNSQARNQRKEDEIMTKHTEDRLIREQTQKEAFDQRQRMGGAMGGGGPQGARQRQQMSLAEKAKFQFEADEEDDAMENEIHDNLGQIGDAAARLKQLALATSKEVDYQNDQLTRLTKKTDKVDDQIAMNTARLRKFGA